MKVDVIYNKSSQRMTELPDDSIDMILTSCPYWGLRDYGEDVREIWGGDPDCEHEFENYVRPAGGGHANPDKAQVGTTKKDIQRIFGAKVAFCQKCGAWYGQLGLEPTLEMYIEHLLLITLECKRVLKPTGVMWWNHGDSYFTGKGSCKNPGGGNKSWKSWNDRKGIYPRGRSAPNRMSKEHPPKCLALQNYRLIIRMIDEQGWILRNNAIWNKPNGMPASVKDRLANKYEPIFCLVKNTKAKYCWNEKTGLMADRKPPKDKQKEGIDWDWEEVGRVNKNVFNVRVRDSETDRFMEKATEEEKKKYGKPKLKKKTHWHSLGYWYDLDAIRELYTEPLNRWGGNKIEIPKKTKWISPEEKAKWQASVRQKTSRPYSAGKNPGDIWTIPTQPRPEAHFATFPDKLCIKPILATCPLEICRKCGKARVRIKEKPLYGIGDTKTKATENGQPNIKHLAERRQFYRSLGYESPPTAETIGWTDCGCNAGWDSGVLLDPFAGRGTALIMAKKLGRHFIGYELKKEYCEKLIKPALEEIDPLFNWKTSGLQAREKK